MSQWEQLVTEGHVRAARWRTAVKFIVTIAVCLIVAGLIGVQIVPREQNSSRIAQAKQELVIARQRALTDFIADKGVSPTALPADASNAIRREQVTGLIGQWLADLKKSNALPQQNKNLDPKVFWGGDWTPGTVAAVTSGRSILIGFYVNEAPVRLRIGDTQPEQPPPQLARVFGLFHRSKESWSFYCLAMPRAAPCSWGETIFPAAIPATMKELMPDIAFEPRKDARP